MDGIVVIAFVLSMLALGVTAIYAEWRRREDLREEAERLGLAFHSQGDPAAAQGLPHPLFQRGDSRSMTNLLEGSSGSPRVRVFEYRYATGNDEHRTFHQQTVAAFQVRDSRLPAFELFPKPFYHWFVEVLGGKDIHFDAAPRFSKAYRLLGADEAAVRGLFNAAVLAEFASRPGWTVEGAGQTLLIYRPNRLVEAKHLPGFLKKARSLAALFGAR